MLALGCGIFGFPFAAAVLRSGFAGAFNAMLPSIEPARSVMLFGLIASMMPVTGFGLFQLIGGLREEAAADRRTHNLPVSSETDDGPPTAAGPTCSADAAWQQHIHQAMTALTTCRDDATHFRLCSELGQSWQLRGNLAEAGRWLQGVDPALLAGRDRADFYLSRAENQALTGTDPQQVLESTSAALATGLAADVTHLVIAVALLRQNDQAAGYAAIRLFDYLQRRGAAERQPTTAVGGEMQLRLTTESLYWRGRAAVEADDLTTALPLLRAAAAQPTPLYAGEARKLLQMWEN